MHLIGRGRAAQRPESPTPAAGKSVGPPGAWESARASRGQGTGCNPRGMAAGAPMDSDAILALLDGVSDPEIPGLSIRDLGIVRGVVDNPPRVLVTPTYTGCPATVAIEQMIRAALDGAGYADVHIERVLFPAWTTDWI